ncbi:ABC transporter ATP-binding protein [candidate division WOR-3 bacterium]|uniref:ABC transporter ATP-binding protein n=1 Tax=candidate division WOR-3 bacterium TaxID=2052148 RepID=A0A938BV55_UNCW3|nr:ABC transporter ATP-binding protein [candidate division WOR-3 bacterium]
MSEAISIEGLSKSFDASQGSARRLAVISDLSLDVGAGEFITVFGPNGCGKTTLLNILSGLVDPDRGRVSIAARDGDRAVMGYVFQNFAASLFPWLRVIDNIAFPLELRGVSRSQRQEKVLDLLRRFRVDFDPSVYPYQLSGGQQQLVAIMRAVIDSPDVLFLDEPFNALDFQTRTDMEDRVLEIWETLKPAVLFVSHDIDEAIYLADRVVFLSRMPARVAEVLPVPLPRPRSQRMLVSSEFYALRTHAIAAFARIVAA